MSLHLVIPYLAFSIAVMSTVCFSSSCFDLACVAFTTAFTTAFTLPFVFHRQKRSHKKTTPVTACHASCAAGLQHERSEVRQMCSALLNNLSLALADATSAKAASTTDGSSEMSDEVTQILFGVLDGLQDETSQVCA